jgi:endonuclease I
MGRIRLTAAALGTVALGMMAEVPEGYYTPLDGKSGAALEQAIKTLAEGHTRITYNTKTWPAFEKTDVRVVNGREVWWDMYSNKIVYTDGHDALNIEHSVANSWFGGQTQASGTPDAYADLFHLNPSDQEANGQKGNYPPGVVAEARLLDNGLFKVGTPVSGQGGGSASVFEPADEYKGDFARAYFYIFTAYPDARWQDKYAYVYGADGKLEPWAAELLLEWHRNDPVDSKELSRNEEIYKLQKNRNPFIDYPGLAEYVWGDKTGDAFEESSQPETVAADRPEAPVFTGTWMTGVNTYNHRWWDGYTQTIDYDTDCTLMVSIDGRDYYESEGVLMIDPAMDGAESHTYRAYTVSEKDGTSMRSSTATLTVTARDPNVTDWSAARWERVEEEGELDGLAGHYLLFSSNTLHVMSATQAKNGFMLDAGFTMENDNGEVVELPVEAAIVTFEPVDNSKYRLMVSDIYGSYKGSWSLADGNKMSLSQSTYTPAVPSLDGDGQFIYTFDGGRMLMFNKAQPRFTNYASNTNQGIPVYLYRFLDFNTGTGVETLPEETPWAVGVDGDSLIVPEGTVVYDLSGRRIEGKALGHGVYIVVGGGQSQKIVM